MIINRTPKNKEQFERLKGFAKEVISILETLNVEPILWGSLAFFAYTKPTDFAVNDIDFLVPKNCLKKVLDILKNKNMKYNYVEGWDCLQIFKDDLRIELDPIEYYGKFDKLQEIDFNGLNVKAISLDDLRECYRKAYQDSRVAEVGPKKEEQYRAKYEQLKQIKEVQE